MRKRPKFTGEVISEKIPKDMTVEQAQAIKQASFVWTENMQLRERALLLRTKLLAHGAKSVLSKYGLTAKVISREIIHITGDWRSVPESVKHGHINKRGEDVWYKGKWWKVENGCYVAHFLEQAFALFVEALQKEIV